MSELSSRKDRLRFQSCSRDFTQCSPALIMCQFGTLRVKCDQCVKMFCWLAQCEIPMLPGNVYFKFCPVHLPGWAEGGLPCTDGAFSLRALLFPGFIVRQYTGEFLPVA